jgi:hypothetical protein
VQAGATHFRKQPRTQKQTQQQRKQQFQQFLVSRLGLGLESLL